MFDDLMNENASPPPPPTHVTVQFEPQGNQTAIRVNHIGWGSSPRWTEARNWHIRAWAGVIQNLAAFMEGRELPINWKTMPKT